MDFPGVLIGLTEIAVALAGFTGSAMQFGRLILSAFHD